MHNKRPRYDLMEYKRREFLTALSPQSHPSNPDFNPSATEMKKRSGLFAGKHAELSRPIMAPWCAALVDRSFTELLPEGHSLD